MESLTSLKKALGATGLYRLDGSNVEKELIVYAEELDRLNEKLGEMYREAFIETAQGYGLAEYEKIFSRERDSLSADKRRELIEKRMSLTLADFTRKGIEKALESFSLGFVMTEYPTLLKLNIIAQGDYTAAEEDWIREQTAKIIPAHLEFQMVFNTLSWDEMDEKERIFSEWDALKMTWNDLDNMKKE